MKANQRKETVLSLCGQYGATIKAFTLHGSKGVASIIIHNEDEGVEIECMYFDDLDYLIETLIEVRQEILDQH